MSPYRVGAKNMVDRGKARDVNEAARRFAETLAESYRVVYAQAAESGERQQRLAQEFSELVANNLKEQADRQQEAGRALAKESLGAYMDFLDSTFSQYRAGAMASGQTAAGVVGAVGDATARTMEAATEGPQRTAETATFPIAGYDELNVEEISERIDALTDEQVRRLRDYEGANQNRKTLMERFESRLRASS
jgi:hypothetical protein